MNVNCMEVGGLSIKDSPQPQSRLSQWTHPNSMENLSGNSSPMEPNYSKHGMHFCYSYQYCKYVAWWLISGMILMIFRTTYFMQGTLLDPVWVTLVSPSWMTPTAPTI